MSNVYLVSDPHLGHGNILKFTNGYRAKVMGVKDIKEHDEKFCDNWSDTISKRDTVIVMGDLGKKYHLIKSLSGHKTLILGNHDIDHITKYMEIFDNVRGPHKYKGFWLSHFPIHPEELFGKKNIHGHVHTKNIQDERYINVSLEMTKGYPIAFQEIKSGNFKTHDIIVPQTSMDIKAEK